MKQSKIITIITLAFVCVTAQAYVAKDFSSHRKLFLQVEAELKKGKLNAYRKHKQALQNYPLFPYLKYELLHLNINTLKHSELSAFISTYYDSPVSERLRKEWLNVKAKKKHWEEFLLAYDTEKTNDIVMQCHYLNARLTAKHDKTAYQEVSKIWLSSKSLPKECDSVFEKWKQAGGLQRTIIWQRIKLAIEDGNLDLAKYLGKELADHEQKIVELWIRTHNDPHLITKQHNFTAKHSAINEILTHGMRKIARKDPEEAVKLWHALEKQHKFNEHHWGAVVKEIGLSLSRRLNSNAEKWLGSVPATMQGLDVHNARLKVAVYHNSWQTIAKVYNSMNEEDRRSDKWQYWYARSLEMMGDREQSQSLLQDLAQLRT
jgi:soluble lytic murein transglycosylase